MVELFEQSERYNARQSSKGNQLKWENNGIWYKADYSGYEGLAEYMISHLLQKSTLMPEEFVLYNPVQIRYKRQVYNAVQSNSFLTKDWQIITLERLFQNHFGESLYKLIWAIENHETRLKFLVAQVERITGLREFGAYITKLFTIDALFLNEDRHMHNIAVLMNTEGDFKYCPIFDNGAGLLSDTALDFPLEMDPIELMGEAEAKSICRDFEEQLELAENIYGNQMKFYFTRGDVDLLLEEVDFYPEDVKNRVRTILYQQMRKYAYLF